MRSLVLHRLRKRRSKDRQHQDSEPFGDQYSLLQSEEEDQYRPLELRTDEIRLVKVLPTIGDVIECSVWHAPQSSTYTCLSYRCGKPEDGSKLIRVNGKPHRVLSNLWDFLDLARRTLRDESLWIDALCINQQDPGEKATQVSRMGIIYSSCRHTRIWLGKSQDAQQLFEAPWALTQDVPLVTRLIGDNLYWRRAWIVQEVLLSTHRTIHISDVSIEWALLQSLYNRLSDEATEHGALNILGKDLGTESDEDWFLASEAASFLKQLRDGNIMLESQSFPQLLKHHSYTRCTLWQDHIFALLPLSAGGATFPVDYNKSICELLFESLRSFNHGQCLCWVETLAHVLDIRSHFSTHKLTSVDLRKLMRPIIEVRVYAGGDLLDRPQAQEDPPGHHRIDLRTTLPFDAELDIELEYDKQTGSHHWHCRHIHPYDDWLAPKHYSQEGIGDSAICSSIEIFQTESTPARATPLIVRLSQLALLHLAERPFRLGHHCSSYLWKDDQAVKFCA